jgi:hypothetical protein
MAPGGSCELAPIEIIGDRPDLILPLSILSGGILGFCASLLWSAQASLI